MKMNVEMNATQQFYYTKLASPYKGAQYYMGVVTSKTVQERLQEHRSGQGSKFLRAVNAVGIAYDVKFTIPIPDDMYYWLLEGSFKNKRKASLFDVEIHGEEVVSARIQAVIAKAKAMAAGKTVDEQKRITLTVRGGKKS